MTYFELIRDADRQLDDGRITLGEYEKMIEPMERQIQPEEAIPISWIEAKITQLISMDNEFAGLTVHIIKTMLNEWKQEQEGEQHG